MKKILEVLQYGENEIRFYTDMDVDKDPDVMPNVMSDSYWSMTTKLWGGKEGSVLAMIRALIIAALVTCDDRLELLNTLDEQSEYLADFMAEARKEAEKRGIRIEMFPPNVQPPAGKS